MTWKKYWEKLVFASKILIKILKNQNTQIGTYVTIKSTKANKQSTTT
jgi:hypothetical protein